MTYDTPATIIEAVRECQKAAKGGVETEASRFRWEKSVRKLLTLRLPPVEEARRD